MQSHEPIHIDNDSSKPIIIPGKDSSVPNDGSFVPESYQTARSFKTSPQAYQFSTSANSTHSQVLNNSYSHQFVNNFNNLRNPYNAHSPTSNFSPRADPPSFISRNSFVESNNNTILPNPSLMNSTSAPRPSLLTSKLASSNTITQQQQQQPSIPEQETQQQYNDSFNSQSFNERHIGFSDQTTGSHQDENPFLRRSSNISIQPPTTSQHFKQSEIVNSYTPYHNTPSAVSSSYSSAPHSVPTSYVQSSSYQNPASYSRTPQNNQNHVQTEYYHKTNQVQQSQSLELPTQTTRGGFSDSMETDNELHQHFQPQTSIECDLTQGEQQSTESENLSDESHLDIVNHPVDDLLMMLSTLLQKIIEANDNLHPHHYHQASQLHDSNKFTANVLAFHGRNVPAISIHAYLSRILKYCPVTNEVFLTLLVYFDRIAKRANTGTEGFTEQSEQEQLFVMDSYNIHRLIIAGITVASKFFSDIFYKNSRYAKVGGLPLEELNHLELQFLLLTDFRLLIQIEELQRYADLLLKFWKREQSKKEEQAQHTQPQTQSPPLPPSSTSQQHDQESQGP